MEHVPGREIYNIKWAQRPLENELKTFHVTVFYPNSRDIRFQDAEYKAVGLQQARDSVRMKYKCQPCDLWAHEVHPKVPVGEKK